MVADFADRTGEAAVDVNQVYVGWRAAGHTQCLVKHASSNYRSARSRTNTDVNVCALGCAMHEDPTIFRYTQFACLGDTG